LLKSAFTRASLLVSSSTSSSAREQFVARLGEIGFQRRDLPSKGLVVLGDGGGQRLTVGAGVTARFLGSRVRGAVRPAASAAASGIRPRRRRRRRRSCPIEVVRRA